ncbi:hypothetical protein BXT86_00395 [candidate division WOR-3 bacterium 4484_100]|uniref:indole-3-glycerol-phosphate synthase n=1 Tax=candidate division WOR-3 bacterium 4484_100 TaxID=1936077 RepID=A0A1V4QH70_UNCW3|nr:MAG: hypothetical protein BXT86_00395 [candidate division WOR-3 bacterium 4484_100]
MGLLNRIITQKRKEVELRKGLFKIEYLRRAKFPELRDFKGIFRKRGFAVIAEVKRFSPSAGIIVKDFDLQKIVCSYETDGASALSILTDYVFFGGRDGFIFQAKRLVNLPILRKDFIIDEYQVFESRWLGADAILLIARLFTQNRLSALIELAQDIGLACLIEVHNLDELRMVLKTPAQMIGINNRDLDTQKVNIENSFRLKQYIPEGYIVISESGIRNSEHIKGLIDAGFDGALIGEALLRAYEGEGVAELLRRDYARS